MKATFESAMRFGLTHEEAWRAIDDALELAGADASVAEFSDELTEALSRRILFKQRIAHS
jgi:hypothetical protein